MDQQLNGEAFEVLPPASSEFESGPSAEAGDGEFSDEVRYHGSTAARHGAWVRPPAAAHHANYRTTPVRYHAPQAVDWRTGWRPSAGTWPSAHVYPGAPRYGFTRYATARPWSGASWARWPYGARGRWPTGQGWYRPGWPGWGGPYAQGMQAPTQDGDDGPDYPPPPPPVIFAAPPMVAPPVIDPAAQAALPIPAPDPAGAAVAPGAPPQTEYGGYGPGQGFGMGQGQGYGRRHHRHCGCGACRRGGSSMGLFQREAGEGFEAAPAFEQDESGDEFELKPAPACAPYAPGEVERSTSAAGLLPADVIDHPRGTLVADFGVNWRTPRDALARDPLLANRLRAWLDRARTDPTTRLRILGFSDCVGPERDNLYLRKGRATRLAALLERMAGPAAWAALRPRITAVEAAPVGEFVATNATVEGRAQNRGVLVEFVRTIDMAPMTLQACNPGADLRQRYPLVALLPNVADYRGPLPIEYRLDAKKMVGELAQDISLLGPKAHVFLEGIHWGIAAAEMFELLGEATLLAGVLSVLAPVIAGAAVFIGLGAPYAEAAEQIAGEWSASGFSRGLVMAADGRGFRDLKRTFGFSNRAFPDNHFFPRGKSIAIANYRAGLVAGYAQGRALCPAQRAILMRDLGRRMGNQSWRGPQPRWTARGWSEWYTDLAATFRATHLGG